jgi:MtN3 and saliva related transmembrane protein
MSDMIDTIGYAAAFLTTASFIPQAWLTFKTKDVSGISVGMYSAFTLGIALWLVYGLMLRAWPIVIANVITLALASAILAMRLRYGKRQYSATHSPAHSPTQSPAPPRPWR